MFAITYKKIFLIIAGFVMTTSVLLIAVLGLNLGIDFTGGSLTEVAYNNAPAKEEVEAKISEQDLGGFSVRESEDDAGRPAYLIRTIDLTDSERDTLAKNITELGEGEKLPFHIYRSGYRSRA